MMKDKILDVTNYGICLFSPSELKTFLKHKGKGRTSKILQLFQKNNDLYLDSISSGAWLPIVEIDSIDYLIKVSNDNESFDQDWEKVFCYADFNICIGLEGDIWIGSIGKLLNWKEEEFLNQKQDVISYKTLDGEKLNSAFRYKLNNGKYLLKIEGYRKKEKNEFPYVNSGFLFTFTKVKEFTGYNDPREDDVYKFNSINM